MPVLKSIKQWAGGVLIAGDQFINSLFFGYPDETVSSRLGRRRNRKRRDAISEAGCAVLDAIQENHCGMSIEETETGETDPHHLGKVIHEIPRDPASRLTKIRNAGFVVVLALGLGSCKDVKIPRCPSGTTGQWPLCEVVPSPVPSVTPPPASPSPAPSAEPTPVLPTPVPPTPKPAKPCKVDESTLPCWTCAARLAYDVQHQNLTWDPGTKLYFNDPPGKAREYFDRSCNKVRADGSVLRTGYEWFGTYPETEQGLCPQSMLTCPSPSPTPSSSPSPEATPQPGPTPATCPVLVRWGGGIHAQMNPQHQGLPKEPAFAGNTIDFDSTARFGSGRGQPCNDEHHAVCSASGRDDDPNWRHCEDPRGPNWEIVSCGGKETKEINGGWGYRIVAVDRGRCCLSITPRRDVQDAMGQPVRVGPSPGTETCVDVQ